jgi:GntR family transcriptional regulator
MTAENHFFINRNSNLPLYDQIENNIRDLITQGILKEGDTIPSEWELARIYGVSRLTIRKALGILVQKNWLIKRQGVGTFVTKPKVASIIFKELSFTKQMLAIGRIPSSKLIRKGVAKADHNTAQYLEINPGSEVIEITRLRLADDIPILFETSYLSYNRFKPLVEIKDWTNKSLYQLLNDHFQIQIARMDQILKPILLTDEQAKYLKAVSNTPSILSYVLAYSKQGEPIEYSVSVANGKNTEFIYSFQLGNKSNYREPLKGMFNS